MALWPSPDRSSACGLHTCVGMPGETGESIMVLCKSRGRLGLAVPSIALLLLLTFAGLGNASAATTHYISKSTGSDSNNGTAKTSPWAHLPGMPSCTANCASYTPGAGDQFILMGGDTW